MIHKWLDEAEISFTHKDGEKKTLTYEEKKDFLLKTNSRLMQAFIVGIPLAMDDWQYKLENSPYDKK